MGQLIAPRLTAVAVDLHPTASRHCPCGELLHLEPHPAAIGESPMQRPRCRSQVPFRAGEWHDICSFVGPYFSTPAPFRCRANLFDYWTVRAGVATARPIPAESAQSGANLIERPDQRAFDVCGPGRDGLDEQPFVQGEEADGS